MINAETEAKILKILLKIDPKTIGHNKLVQESGVHSNTVVIIRERFNDIIRYDDKGKGKTSGYSLYDPKKVEQGLNDWNSNEFFRKFKFQKFENISFSDLIIKGCTSLFAKMPKVNAEKHAEAIGTHVEKYPIVNMKIAKNYIIPDPNEIISTIPNLHMLLTNLLMTPISQIMYEKKLKPTTEDLRKINYKLLFEVDLSSIPNETLESISKIISTILETTKKEIDSKQKEYSENFKKKQHLDKQIEDQSKYDEEVNEELRELDDEIREPNQYSRYHGS